MNNEYLNITMFFSFKFGKLKNIIYLCLSNVLKYELYYNPQAINL